MVGRSTGFLGTMTLLLVILATENGSPTTTTAAAAATIPQEQNGKTTAGELMDVLRLLTDNKDSEDDDETTSITILGPKIRRSGTSRPKYDPGLKWIGLGKRLSMAVPEPPPQSPSLSEAPIGTELFTDMRRFFDVAHKSLVRNRAMNDEKLSNSHPDQVAAFLKQRRGGGPTPASPLRNIQENNNPKKSYYNPSLLWAGLGR